MRIWGTHDSFEHPISALKSSSCQAVDRSRRGDKVRLRRTPITKFSTLSTFIFHNWKMSNPYRETAGYGMHSVALQVKDLRVSLAWYQHVLGKFVHCTNLTFKVCPLPPLPWLKCAKASSNSSHPNLSI